MGVRDAPVSVNGGQSELRLLVQNPRVVFAYWELSAGLKEALWGRKVELRLFNEKGKAVLAAEIELAVKNYYFTGLEPDSIYTCEIGVINRNNEFYPLLRSNAVRTPSVGQQTVFPLAEKGADAHKTVLDISSASSWVYYAYI